MECWLYDGRANSGNPTSCSSQGSSDDGNVVGTYYNDAANSSLSHTAAYTYDPTHRLTSAVASGNSTYNLAFSFDQYGNMTCSQNQNTNGPCPQYSFNSSTNQISNSGYTYDASGDLTSDGVHTYQYDAEGRMTSVDNGTTATYIYNALGQRVEKDVAGTYTEYLFDSDGNPVGENNRTTWTDTWIIFNGQHVAHYQNGETYFMHANNVGTTAFVTDYTGAVIQDETHYPWGQEWNIQGTMEEERFASLQHRDSETALDPTHFRMYNSGQGRWHSPDPVRSCPFHPENFDRYPYASNNPGNRIDPRGDVCYGLAYDEFDYLENFGFVPDFSPYGCGYPFGIAFAYYRFLTLTYQRNCKCKRANDYPIQVGKVRGCGFTCVCSDYSVGGAIFTVAQMEPKCGPVVEYECPPAVETTETVNLLYEFFGILSIGEPTITGCTPP